MMDNFPNLFEVLASDQSDARLASRKALVLSRDRIDARLGKFLAASQGPTEFDARYDLVSEDFAGIVRVAADEVGHEDPDSLVETLHAHYREAGKPPWLEEDDSDEESDTEAEEKPKSKKDKKKDKKNKDEDSDDDEGDDEGDDSLEFAAKTAGAVPFQRTADGNTGLAGPSPKMDKKRWTPKSVQPIDVPSERHPTVQKDVTEVMPKNNLTESAHDMDETNALTTVEELPSGTGMDDAGFAGNNQDMAPHTKTFGDGGQTDPVKSEFLEA